MEKSLTTPIRYLKGIGPKRSEIFSQLGINIIEDLLYYFPRRYEDRTKLSPIAKLKVGQTQTIKAEVLSVTHRRSFRRRGFSITEATVGDKTGKIHCVWFNQPYLKDYFKPGTSVILYGEVRRYGQKLQMSSPEFEIIEGLPPDAGTIVPVYSLPHGITQRYLRKIIKNALDEYLSKLDDFLPYDVRLKNNFLNLAKSILNIHFPENLDFKKQAYQRLAFEEFFLFQLPLALRKIRQRQRLGIAHKIEGELVDKFMQNLPFKLTQAQSKAIEEIKLDMANPRVMQRLLQGDVGSGKTVVATVASLFAIQGGYQAAFMVPTEILAKQHFEKIGLQATCLPAGRAGYKLQDRKIKIGLLTSSLNKKEKEKVYEEIKEGKIDLVIGTHALLEEGVEFRNLGLIVVDEQHKFGVGQRALLPQKSATADVLIMTATPIPRTLAITLYGDLDISVINELPPGRSSPKTMLFSEDKVLEAYNIAKEQLKKGFQSYIVYPVIEESYALDLIGAKKMYDELKKKEFKDFRMGLIHGKQKQSEQDQVMKSFRNKELDVLVSTTVLEVGIDVSNATCMIIESAQRFGLSQLHQLRGRIGRGGQESFCLLISDTQASDALVRLSAMIKYSDGFRIAEEDLKIRGPGEFFGRRQHGLTELKIADPLAQMHLLKKAREEAIKLINTDPHLELRQNTLLKDKLLQRFPEYEKLVVVG